MRPIRVLYSSNQPGLESKIDELVARAREVRREPGCLDFDVFRGTEYPENFAQLELWENAAAFDRHWKKWGESGVLCDIRNLTAPYHRGAPELPRRDGRNGAEFYPYEPYTMTPPIFIPQDESERIDSIRWPSRGGVRIVILSSVDPASDASFFPYAAETRAQPGCLEFDFLRSLEFPENLVHTELWQGPAEVYDGHFFTRRLHAVYGLGLPRPPTTAIDGRYRDITLEFYQHSFFALSGSVWEPENPIERMLTIRWYS